MARNEQLIRQHKIMQILERVRFGKTIQELHDDVIEELGLPSLHNRTLKRDLEALQAAGFDVDQHDSPRGKIWKLGPLAKTTTHISFSSTELIALALGRELMHPLSGTQFGSGIDTFWNKVKEEVPATVLSHYEKYRKTFRVQGLPIKSYESKQGIIKTINRGILEHRVLEVVYQSENKPAKTRKIEPYEVILFRSSLYTIAAAHDDEDEKSRVRVWKLDRFSKATILDEWFKPPEDLDMDEFFGSSQTIFRSSDDETPYKVKLTSRATVWVTEEPWHPEQVIEKISDTHSVLTVPVSNPRNILPKILALGADAELLSPEDRRQELKVTAKEMVEHYED
jgi:predicted DNA-binding transcriptional regulator YafY